MSIKRILCPARVRRIPRQFSWVDQRLVRDHRIASCSADVLALYLFLLTVADAQGLSHYSDQAVLRHLLCLDAARLAHARAELQQAGWIAYEPPLYQVLALDAPERSGAAGRLLPKPPAPRRSAQPVAMVQLLRRALEGDHDQL